jgi:hypothetical protein
MFLSSAEIARGMQGAFRLLQRDSSAPLYFDNTMEACLRSFRLMVLVAPLYALYVVLAYSQVEIAADEWEIAAVEGLRYVIDWVLFPVLFYEIARQRRWLDRYPRYIGALNWISLPAMFVLLVDVLVSLALPSTFASIFDLVAQALLFYWIVMTSRMTLGVGWGIAGVLLIVNWVPSLFLSLLVNRFLGIGAAAAAGT